MDSDQIYLAIEHVAGNRSKKFKEGWVARYGENPEFRRVLVAALNPFVTYGIAKIPPYSANGGDACFDEETWALLDRLAKRELTGAAARGALAEELAGLSHYSAELLERILTKDLRAGFTEGTVNRAIPGLVPTFDCMLAHPFDVRRVKRWPVMVEPKLDGVRVLAFVTLAPTPTVKFFSRSGKEFTTFDHLKQPILEAFERWPATESTKEFVLDGEVVSGSFNKTVSEVRRKSKQATDAVFVVFDLLTREAFDAPDAAGWCSYAPMLAGRRAWLLGVFPEASYMHLVEGLPCPVMAAPQFEVETEAEIHDLYADWRELGLEGAIVKLDSYYRRDRDYGWMKLKAEESVDVPIIGAEEGTGKYVGTLGALVVDFNGVQVRVSGMSDALRDEMWEAYRLEALAGHNEEAKLTGRLAEVIYHEVTPDGSLRHPRFKRFRDDKPAQ
jgi:DNA ligase-1